MIALPIFVSYYSKFASVSTRENGNIINVHDIIVIVVNNHNISFSDTPYYYQTPVSGRNEPNTTVAASASPSKS